MSAVAAASLTAAAVLSTVVPTADAQTTPMTSIPFAGVDSAPAASDDGGIIAFVSVDLGGVSNIVVHDRRTVTTSRVVGSSGGSTPAVSGDGCVVAWVVPGDAAAETPVVPALWWVDRCATPELATPQQIALTPSPESIGRPALSVDGAALAVSTVDAVRIFERTPNGPGYDAGPIFDGPDPLSAQQLTAPRVDMSDDGSVVVFAAGSDLADESSLSVYRRALVTAESVDAVTLVGRGHDPSVSGDGFLVAFARTVGVEPDAGRTTWVVDTQAGPPVDEVLLGEGGRPVISADGRHVVFDDGQRVTVVSRTGSASPAFVVHVSTVLVGLPVPANGATIDRLGATIATDTAPVDPAPVDPEVASWPDIVVTTRAADATFDAASFALGEGQIGTESSTTATLTNRGPATFGATQVVVDAPFRIVSETCTPFVPVGATCSVVVAVTVDTVGEVTGQLTVSGAGIGAPVVAQVSVIGLESPPESTVPPPTTSPPPTGGSSTGGSTTGGSTRGSTSGGSTRGSTSGGSTRGTSTTRGGGSSGGSSSTGDPFDPFDPSDTPTAPGAGLSLSPDAFDFAPTIVAAGRRTGLVEIANESADPVSVSDVGLEPLDVGFEIVESACVGSTIVPGERCAVTIAFAPSSEGPLSTQLTVSLDDGLVLSAPISGVGAPPPALTVQPGVARPGQVVTLEGSGFPTGLTVQVAWNTTSIAVVVDETGSFAVPVAVLPRTNAGPMTANVAGQLDQFGDVTASMLVTSTTSRSAPGGVLDGIGPNVGR